jgi:peptidoglycan hydrolase-like protein with peptidoglycan-binding domain
MNRSYSKIRHIQEANVLLEKKILSEQTGLAYGNEPAPIAGVTDTATVQATTTTAAAAPAPAATTQSTETATADTTQQPKEVQGKEKTAELVGTLQELLKTTYKQNIVVDKKYGPKTAQAILAALNTLKK